jgi:teichuronic acid biosynthesis glycosyltransferase TuaC
VADEPGRKPTLMSTKVLVVTEYFPRDDDPTLGIWAHHQTLATRDAGVEARVLVLHRPLPPLSMLRKPSLRRMRQIVGQTGSRILDGLPVDYVRYLSPPRPLSYASWGAWAAPALRRAFARIRPEFPFELVHAHYAVPAGDAVRRVAPDIPLIVSVHGGDVYGDHAGSAAVRRTLTHARLVLANSAGTAQRCREHGARMTRVVHLGTDLPSLSGAPRPSRPTLVSVGNLIARKRHADLIVALARLRERHPDIRCVIVGDGPERERLEALSASLGVEQHLELRGRVAHPEAVAAARAGSLFVLVSVDEAFGVAYIEAMAGGVPAIGCAGEDGPEEIAAAGGGIVLVASRDPRALAAAIDPLLAEPSRLEEMGLAARLTVERQFSWPGCGRETVAAYRDVLHGPTPD